MVARDVLNPSNLQKHEDKIMNKVLTNSYRQPISEKRENKINRYIDIECMKYSLALTLISYVKYYIDPVNANSINLSEVLISAGITHSPIILGELSIFVVTWTIAYLYVKFVLYLFPFIRSTLRKYIP